MTQAALLEQDIRTCRELFAEYGTATQVAAFENVAREARRLRKLLSHSANYGMNINKAIIPVERPIEDAQLVHPISDSDSCEPSSQSPRLLSPLSDPSSDAYRSLPSLCSTHSHTLRFEPLNDADKP